MRNKTIIIVLLLLASFTCNLQAQKSRVKTKNAVAPADTVAWNDTTQFRRIEQACEYVRHNYVEQPNYQKITEKAITSMLAELDPHSVYIAAKDVPRANEGLQGNFEGVGLAFQIVNDTISVTEVIVGGPSEKVGLQIGDKLIRVDDTTATFKGVNNNFVFRHLRGKKGTQVRLTVKRNGVADPLVFNIIRDKVPIYSVDTYFMLDEEVGYVRLTRFARTSAQEVQKAINALKRQGMKRLIFDLRGNSGGYLDIACAVANQFLDPGRLIVYTEGEKSPRQNFVSRRGGSFTKGSLVILIDEYSASASEIVSGAMQDWDRATLVGRRTFGKGLVQRLFEMYDGAQMRLTTARYYTPSGRCIQKPYTDGKDAYNLELQRRLDHNELVSTDSIVFPDSLKFTTRNGRTVYGGGGIMPDVFVPLDTVRLSDYFLSLRSAGHFNTFALEWADQHRNDSNYATFERFEANYSMEQMSKSFADYVASRDNPIVRTDVRGEWVASWMNDQARKVVTDTTHRIHAGSYVDYMDQLLGDTAFLSQLRQKAQSEDRRSQLINERSDVYMGYLIKSLIARNLFGIEYYYRVMKEQDPALLKALETIKKD